MGFILFTQLVYSQVEGRFTVCSGIWQPLGNLGETFYPAASFGFFQNIESDKEFKLKVGALVNAIGKSGTYDFVTRDSTFQTETEGSGNAIIGLWLMHTTTKWDSKIILDKVVGLGLNNLYTNTNNPNLKGKGNYSFETINLSAGVNFWFLSKKMNPIGFFLNYNFSPYFLFGRVKRGFGNSSLIFGFQYNLLTD